MPNSTCFVPGCKSGYKSCKERVSMFTPPRDEQLFRKWERAIPRADRQLTRECTVCAKHFHESEITRERTVVHEGQVILRYAINPQLQDSAVPSLFPGCPGYLSKPDKHIRKSPTKRAQLPQKRGAKRKVEDATEDIGTDGIKGYLTKLCEVTFNTENIAVEDAGSTSPLLPREEPQTTVDVFHTLQMDIDKLKPIDETWAVQFRFASPKFISVAQMTVNYENKPYVSKQVLITEDMQVQLYVNSKLLKHEGVIPNGFVVRNIEDVRDLVLQVSTQKVCEGGPKLRSYPDVLPEKAYSDVNGRWRHVNCCLVMRDSSMCQYCMRLEKVLQQNIRRQGREKKFQRMVSKPCYKISTVRNSKTQIQQKQRIKKMKAARAGGSITVL